MRWADVIVLAKGSKQNKFDCDFGILMTLVLALTADWRRGSVLNMHLAHLLQLSVLLTTLVPDPIIDVVIANMVSKSHAFVVSLGCRHIIHILII